jgi:hypothetical protein
MPPTMITTESTTAKSVFLSMYLLYGTGSYPPAWKG